MKPSAQPADSVIAFESENPFFSVIIPTYNRGNFISKPIESIIGQSYESWELLIVDDGSTDDTAQIVKTYAADKRIRYIYQQNQERSAARNTGIKHAKGKYICFLDSDDYYLPEHLESFHKKIVLENYPVAVLYCDTYEDLNGRLLRHETLPIKARNPVEWVVQMFLGSPRTCVHHDILKKWQFNPKITLGEDVDLWVRVLKEYPIFFNDSCTVVFVSHAGRTVDIGREDSILAQVALYKRIFRDDQGKFISNDVKRIVMSNVYLRLATNYVLAERRGKAIKALVSSLIASPSNRGKEKIYLLIQQLPLIKQLWNLSRANHDGKEAKDITGNS